MCSLSEACQHHKAPASSRRRRLWELEQRCYCSLVGVCFEVDELRRMLVRSMDLPKGVSDYEVHVTAVHLCEKRSPFSELLQRELERRYALILKRFRMAKTPEHVLALWHESLQGPEVRGALWAAWSHPQCDDMVSQLVYADIHMLQHQLGCVQRREQGYVQKLEQENLRLATELAAIQQRMTAFRVEKIAQIDDLRQQLQQRNEDLQRVQAEMERLTVVAEQTAHPARLLHELASVQQRMLQTEARLREQAIVKAELTVQLDEMRRENARLEQTIGRLLAQDHSRTGVDASALDCNLSGRCVLCVGGRTGTIDIYRGMVERMGGKFVHHDGGVEESFHRLESSIACADAVICQAGCVNHNAYWLVKDLCKKSGKPCVYTRKPSVSAFLGGLNSLFLADSGNNVPDV